MARHRVRRDAQPPPPGWHDYVEHAAEWILHHKFTVIVAAALVIGLLGLAWAHWRQARGHEAQAWETMAQCATIDELRRALPELEGTRAYPWATMQAATYLYRSGRVQEARRTLEPVVSDPELDSYPRGYCLYLVGCTYLEEGRTEEARKSLEKALTVNAESPFLRELVTQVLGSLEQWPPVGSQPEETEAGPPGAPQQTGDGSQGSDSRP